MFLMRSRLIFSGESALRKQGGEEKDWVQQDDAGL